VVGVNGIRTVFDRSELEKVCREYGVRELALFGSVLRDDFTEESDVDVLVEFAEDSPVRSLFDFIQVKHELEDRVFHREVDLVEKSTLSPVIAQDVLKSRRVLYS
jgi:predicted nucleotidyltransferase